MPASVVFLSARTTHMCGVAFRRTAGYAFMMFHGAGTPPALGSMIRMDVGAPIAPVPIPARLADVQFVPIPEEVADAPSPGAEGEAQGHTEGEADGAPTKNPGRGAAKTTSGL